MFVLRLVVVLFLLVSTALPTLSHPQLDYLRAVCLGGHLVPEPFIVPSLWETFNTFCPNSKDIWNLCECTSQNSWSESQVIPLMENHLLTFLNLTQLECDIVNTNINAIRYPVSFTHFLDPTQDPDEYNKYNSCGLTGDVGLIAFKNVLTLAQKLNVRVILDLHQAQGCQNGFDNGGRAGVKEFFTPQNIQKGINIWKNIINYLTEAELLSQVWGFELLNEPLPDTSGGSPEPGLLQQFTETVVNDVLVPVLTSNQVVVLQPGPGNSLVSAYQSYNLNVNLQYLLDFHEYIVFGSQLYLTTMGSVLNEVPGLATNTFGAKWPYFIGEWSHATTDCAQYLNGAFGGYDPNYYANQHASRSSFYCNNITQERDGWTVGFQTCSVILTNNDTSSYGHCNVGSYGQVFNQYRGAVCKLFTTYLNAFKQNSLNVGFSFWTYTTGSGDRRIQQWDYSWAVQNNIIKDTIDPTPVDLCDSTV